LQRDVTSLLATLAEHRIVAPPNIVDELPYHLAESLARVDLRSDRSSKAASVNVTFPPATQSSSSVAPQSAGRLSLELGSPVRSGAKNTSHVSSSESNTSEYTQQTLLHDPRVGIDFVLAYVLPCGCDPVVYEYSIYSSLERPCLPHLRGSHLDYDDRAETPSEYALLASRDLFTASLQLWRPSLRDRSKPESYDVSVAEIERLLNTSLNIGVKDDEVTPVQIWNFLMNFTIQEDQQREVLEKLAEELCKHVKCSQ
jgi:hypothetical protein